MHHGVALWLNVAAMTHVGQRRNFNEDCIAVGRVVLSASMPAPQLERHALQAPVPCLVADGLGGHPSGHVASRYAIERLSAELPAAYASDDAIIAAIRATNLALYDAMAVERALSGMGTTIAGIAAGADTIAIFNVGDSRIYRVSGGQVERLSVDHSESTPTSFFSPNSGSRVLNQCLGGYPPAEQIHPFLLREPTIIGATYLICSDGLHDMLNDDEIGRCMLADLERSVAALFDQAMAAGGHDNISILLVRIEANP